MPQDKCRKRSATTPINVVAPKRAKKESDSKARATIVVSTATDSALQEKVLRERTKKSKSWTKECKIRAASPHRKQEKKV